MDSSNGTKSLSIPIETFEPKIYCLIIFLDESYSCHTVLMTSSIVNWKESSKNGRKWKSQEFMVVFKSIRSKNVCDNITDSITFSVFSENHRKVRKLSIWLNQQEMEISTFWYDFFFVFSLWLLFIEFRILLLFHFFSFSSHMTRKSSQEKSSYRLRNSNSEFWTFIWHAIYQKKARDL